MFGRGVVNVKASNSSKICDPEMFSGRYLILKIRIEYLHQKNDISLITLTMVGC